VNKNPTQRNWWWQAFIVCRQEPDPAK